MSILFADIYDGIRAIRISKGVCERDILNYVQEKAGGCMKVGNVLKTIRTLKKLVDDGQLVKKGNRYCFPPKDECKDEEEDEEEEEEAPDEDGGDELDMEPDECDEGDDDEEEEEEDDEEEEEEDDDDDEDEAEDDEDEDEEEEEESCDDNEAAATGSGDGKGPEENGKAPDNSPAPPNQGEPDCAGAQKPIIEVSYSRNGIARTIDSNTENNVRKTVKDKNILDQNNAPDRGEAIAFCARDFIDSLAESKSDRGSEEKIEITKASERAVKTQKRFSTASKKSQPPRKRSNVERFGSKSPLQGRKRDFSRIGQELSNNLGFTGVEKEILGESMNSKMEIDVEAEAQTFGVNQKSLARTSPMPEVQIDLHEEKDGRNSLTESGTANRSGSSDGFVENIPKETLKLMQLKPGSYSNMIWYPLEDNDNTQDILQECSSLENSNVVAGKDSMCSICEKKKRTS